MSFQNDLEKPKGSFLGKLLLWGLAAVIIIGILQLVWGIPARLIGREAQKFDAETSRQTYDESRAYQQGTQRELSRICTEYRSQPDGPTREALANEYRNEMSSYTGPVTAMIQRCNTEMGVQ